LLLSDPLGETQYATSCARAGLAENKSNIVQKEAQNKTSFLMAQSSQI
jgi:hypothetical protein